MRTLKFFVLTALMAVAIGANAQSKMMVILKDGTESTFAVSNIDRIVWSDDDTEITVPADLEAVDLGLPSGTKWANMNLGATEVAGSKMNSHTGNPDCYGEYFSWGETSPKDSYGTSSYTMADLREITAETDAATVNWGADWRMPDISDFDELIGFCTIKRTSDYNGTGIKGFVVTGPNGNSIFIPAAGAHRSSGYDGVGSNVYSWLSSYSGTNGPCNFVFDPSADFYDSDVCGGSAGCTIRPVTGGDSGSGEDDKPDTKEAVDLGLSVKWATCNVGASSPEEYGLFFAWGETTGYSSADEHGFEESEYKWCNGSILKLTKYITSKSYGTVDNKTVLESSDDAATANWGGDWRMPTKDEVDELRKNCTWKWTTVNDIKGFTVTGPNGNSIFLPAAGNIYNGKRRDINSEGDYWASTATSNMYAYTMCFDSDYRPLNYDPRNWGQSVRAVCP